MFIGAIAGLAALASVAVPITANAAAPSVPIFSIPVQTEQFERTAPVAFWLEVCIGIILGIACDIVWAPGDDDPDGSDYHRTTVPEPTTNGPGRSEDAPRNPNGGPDNR